MFDLIGNLFWDHIYTEPNQFRAQAGGIANVARELNDKNNQLFSVVGNDIFGDLVYKEIKDYCTPTLTISDRTATATVVQNSTKMSVHNIPESPNIVLTPKNDWAHISYVDTYPGNEMDLTSYTITSGDFINYEEGPLLDYIFLSNDDFRTDIKAKKAFFIHSDSSIVIGTLNRIRDFRFPTENFIDVVGAGDIFAANMIKGIKTYNLGTEIDLLELAKLVHEQTKLRLLERCDRSS